MNEKYFWLKNEEVIATESEIKEEHYPDAKHIHKWMEIAEDFDELVLKNGSNGDISLRRVDRAVAEENIDPIELGMAMVYDDVCPGCGERIKGFEWDHKNIDMHGEQIDIFGECPKCGHEVYESYFLDYIADRGTGEPIIYF